MPNVLELDMLILEELSKLNGMHQEYFYQNQS